MTKAADELPRLLVLASTYPRWAADPEPGFVHELARRLVDHFDVRVLTPHAPGAAQHEVLDGVVVDRYRYAPAGWETLVHGGGIVANLRRAPWRWALVPGFLLALAWSAWRLHRTWRPAVVHAHWLVPQGMVACLPGAAPCLVTSHGADLYALRRWPLPAFKRAVARRAAALTVVSAAMREALAALGVDVARVEVRPMGVDLQRRFVPDPAVARDPDQLLFVGRLVEKKGLPVLLRALPAVLAQRPATRLSIAGFGPEEDNARALCAALGIGHAVEFLGAVPQADLPALYRRAAVFVAPFVRARSGDEEGLGLVLVEALGCGCPVVASDLPAVRDVLDDPVPSGDADALARRLLAVLADPAAARARANSQRAAVAARLDWQPVADGYAGVLARLAAGEGDFGDGTRGSGRHHAALDPATHVPKARTMERSLGLGTAGPPLRVLKVRMGSGAFRNLCLLALRPALKIDRSASVAITLLRRTLDALIAPSRRIIPTSIHGLEHEN